MRNRLSRAVAPATNCNREGASPSALAKAFRTASVALPSSGASVTYTRISPASSKIRARLALGVTRTAISPPGLAKCASDPRVNCNRARCDSVRCQSGNDLCETDPNSAPTPCQMVRKHPGAAVSTAFRPYQTPTLGAPLSSSHLAGLTQRYQRHAQRNVLRAARLSGCFARDRHKRPRYEYLTHHRPAAPLAAASSHPPIS